MHLPFYKYQGTGNDFVIFDNRDNNLSFTKEQIAYLCNRRFGIGADGLMLLNTLAGYDFEMKYYNADGGETSMCGNGGRCMIRFAADRGLQKSSYHFLAIDGVHEGSITDDGKVALKMIDATPEQAVQNAFVVNTGSPHYVVSVDAIDSYDVFAEGRRIRNSTAFAKEGINVNFVEAVQDTVALKVRTYERGVEDETFSCGTGVTAAALVFGPKETGKHQVAIETKGGSLVVTFEKTATGYQNIWLIGPATFVFEGAINFQ